MQAQLQRFASMIGAVVVRLLGGVMAELDAELLVLALKQLQNSRFTLSFVTGLPGFVQLCVHRDRLTCLASPPLPWFRLCEFSWRALFMSPFSETVRHPEGLARADRRAQHAPFQSAPLGEGADHCARCWACCC